MSKKKLIGLLALGATVRPPSSDEAKDAVIADLIVQRDLAIDLLYRELLARAVAEWKPKKKRGRPAKQKSEKIQRSRQGRRPSWLPTGITNIKWDDDLRRDLASCIDFIKKQKHYKTDAPALRNILHEIFSKLKLKNNLSFRIEGAVLKAVKTFQNQLSKGRKLQRADVV